MKNSISFLLFLFLSTQIFSQQTIQVGSGLNNTKGIPYSNEYEYNWCTVIYPQDQINLIGDISKIAYKLFNNPFEAPFFEDAANQKVYMGLTDDLYFASNATYPNTATMTLVFDGTVSWHDSRWGGPELSEITLDTPFAYDNTQNLIIHIENHSDSSKVNPDYQFSTYTQNFTDYPCLHNEANGSFPASDGDRSHYMPNTYITFDPGLDAGVSQIQNGLYTPGTQEIKVKVSNFFTDEITSVDIDWEFDGSPQTTYNWSGSLPSQTETGTITIGTQLLSLGEHTIKAWTVTPNAGIDEDNTNDTMEVNIVVVEALFVDKNVATAGNGSSWANAFDSLHIALEAASSNSIVWVAEGTYMPANDGDRAKSFEIPDSVWVYGGFAGTETSLSERDIAGNPTILSGDIGVEDDASDNSIHIVVAGNYSRLDGFTVSGGNADSTCTNCMRGGGLLAASVEDVYVYNCRFENNNATNEGALTYYFGSGLMRIENCEFYNNSASYGAAIDCHDTPSRISRSVFAGNSATKMGGAIFNWGAVSDPEISNCSFYDNTCANGSAIHNRALGIIGSIKNSIFYGNQYPPVSLSSSAEGDTEISYSLIDQAEFTGNNNITGNPLFADTINYNLQIMGGSPCIDAGDPSSPEDPDGSVADMGAYYFDLDNDAGVVTHFTPLAEFEAGIQAINVSIKNFGKTTLTAVTIDCEIDGVHFANQNWTGSLLYGYSSPQIYMGSYDFGFGVHTIKVWTSNPNSTADEFALNDTLTYQVKSCEYLKGPYTIGPSGDFPGVREAVDSMSNMCGISGPVTFNIFSGTYNDQILIPEIFGLSETTPITFQSLSGDSTDVILTTDSTDYLVFLDGADYITFRNITFTSDKAANLVVLDSGACNNIFAGNILSTGNAGASLVYSGPANDSNNLYQNNLFQGGKYGLNLVGSFAEKESNTRILSNKLGIQAYTSIFLQWSDSANVSGNELQSRGRGIHLIGGYSATIAKNKIRFSGDFPKAGIYLASCNGDTTQSTLIANNFISGKAGYDGAIWISYSSHQKLYHNSINVTQGPAIKLDHGSNITSKNNIFISDGAVIEWHASTEVDYTSDYNSYYSGPDQFVLYGTTNNLEEWQDTSKQDANSRYFMPLFEGEEDLHTSSFLLDSAGTPLIEVTEDIDGESRNTGFPDIGADETDSQCTGPLREGLTIGTSGDYTSFNEAYHAVRNCGVDGKVIFTVENGTYNEQLLIEGPIPGFTDQDSVIFESAGDPESVILTWDADTLSNYTVKLDGAERIVFRNISIQAENNTYGTAILITGGASQNLIEGCILTGPVSDDRDDARTLIYFPGDGLHPDTNNVFKGNTFINGSHGIYLKSSSPVDRGRNNIVSGNEFLQQAATGIHSYYQFNLLVEGNSIENSLQLDIPTYGFSGIFMEYNTDSVVLRGNKINIDRQYQCYGMRIEGKNIWSINNAVSLHSVSQYSTGIFGLGYNFSKCYHNSVNVYGRYSINALDITYNTSSDVEIRNNIFSNHSQGYAIKYSYGTTIESDYNSLFTNGTFIGECNNRQQISDLETWKSVTGAEMHSVSPAAGHFVSDTDLHTNFVLFDAAATPIAAVTKDADGNDRDPATPDIGAYEFSNPGFSLGTDPTVCLDDKYVLTAGEGFDSYLWSTGSDSSSTMIDSSGVGRGSKEISVTVGLDGTDYSDTLTLTFTAPVPAPVPEYCFDHVAGKIEISAGEAFKYYWFNGASTQSIIANYISTFGVTVWDENGCEAYGVITVNPNDCYATMGITEAQTLILSDSLLLNGNINCDENENTYKEYGYTWSSGDTVKSFYLKGSDLGIGTHEIWVKVLNKMYGCETWDTITVNVGENTGLHDISGEKILVYPNPTSRVVNIAGNNIQGIGIYDIKGQLIHSSKLRKEVYEVDLGKYPKGVYIVKITGRNRVYVRNVILQ